jgi:hypothetical protein
MRTTITLDSDVVALVQKLMNERGLTFKEAVNSAIRAGLTAKRNRAPFRTPTFSMGRPTVSLDHALRVADDLADDELRRKLSTGR